MALCRLSVYEKTVGVRDATSAFRPQLCPAPQLAPQAAKAERLARPQRRQDKDAQVPVRSSYAFPFHYPLSLPSRASGFRRGGSVVAGGMHQATGCGDLRCQPPAAARRFRFGPSEGSWEIMDEVWALTPSKGIICPLC